MARSRHEILKPVIAMGIVAMLGCVSAPVPDSQTATVWGYVRLVPKKDSLGAGGGYGDRRLADVKRFDYSHPHYAVVYAPKAPPRAMAPLELRIREEGDASILDPAIAFAFPKHGVSIRNETQEDQIISAPGAGWVQRIAAGGSTHLDVSVEGELTLHLLGGSARASARSALLWVSPGATTRVESSGRYVLDGLPPGSHELRAWHPRLPPTRGIELDLTKGEVHREDVEIGVDAGDLRVEEAP